ncbi:enhancer of split malpha protein [Drosophila grimshawi]|uniref:GH14634 n=1 Tax=Drosophila grimshawi TaxID=7222 RepID=B4IY09_DROGR|nr:enhancer of split malpha protein [Drosophila grimshawi]EDV97552.1 GH14634 [Drosophila grimshawi]
MSAINKQFNHNNKKKLPMYSYKSKVSPTRRLKNLLKPLISHIFKLKDNKQPKRSSYIASEEKETEFDWLSNDMDNMSNEHLENRLIEEIRQCAKEDAIIVYGDNGSGELQTFDQEEDYYVPVHFARTNAGTFFWTSLQPKSAKPYDIEWNFHDRWAQA